MAEYVVERLFLTSDDTVDGTLYIRVDKKVV